MSVFYFILFGSFLKIYYCSRGVLVCLFLGGWGWGRRKMIGLSFLFFQPQFHEVLDRILFGFSFCLFVCFG